MSRHRPTPKHELEEAAQGHDLFRAPGGDLQLDDARDQAAAAGWLPADAVYDWPSVDTRQQIANRRRDLYESMRRLETSAARASGQDDWASGVRQALANLDSALRRHISEIEEPDGLFTEVIDRAPHLASAVEELRKDHRDLVAGCRSALEEIETDRFDVGQVRWSVLGILGRLAIHRQRGSELLFDAYNVDLAAAD